VHGADAGRRQHAHHGLGQGGHVDDQPVAPGQPQVAQRRRKPADFPVKFEVAVFFDLSGGVFENQGQLVAVVRFHVRSRALAAILVRPQGNQW
jgi:hypothetical protein